MPDLALLEQLHARWGWIALRGLIAVIFGVVAFALPQSTLAVLVIVWGAYAFAEGVVSLLAAFRIRDTGHPLWPLVIVGVLGIAAGIATLIWPGITALTLLLLIAGWAIAMGVFQIATAIRLRKAIEGEWLLALSGLLSIVFGGMLVANPGAGALAVVWIIGAYAIAFGVLLIALGFRVRGMHRAPA
jgi:uncharacterized membrane protein HdeD (DUF308 family)